jgi:hypothetical protein
MGVSLQGVCCRQGAQRVKDQGPYRKQSWVHLGISPEKGIALEAGALIADLRNQRQTIVSCRCCGWPGGFPVEAPGTLCCFLWPKEDTGSCPGLSLLQLHLPHCQPQSLLAKPESSPAQRRPPGLCPLPQVRLVLEWIQGEGAWACVHVCAWWYSGQF